MNDKIKTNLSDTDTSIVLGSLLCTNEFYDGDCEISSMDLSMQEGNNVKITGEYQKNGEKRTIISSYEFVITDNNDYAIYSEIRRYGDDIPYSDAVVEEVDYFSFHSGENILINTMFRDNKDTVQQIVTQQEIFDRASSLMESKTR